VFEGVYAEGLWLGQGEPVAFIVAVPDADQTPEMVPPRAGLPPERQFARRLAENGCEVLVPALINRQDTCREIHRSIASPTCRIANGSIARLPAGPTHHWV